MYIRIEVATFEPEPTFQKTINEIKYNHLKTIACAVMNLSAITSLENKFKHLSMNIIIEVAKFEPEPTFENTINDIKDNNLKSITSIDINV